MKKRIWGSLIITLIIVLYSLLAIQPVFAKNVSINTDWSWKAYSAIPQNSTDWTKVNYEDTFWWDVDAPHKHKIAPSDIQNMENTRAQWIWSASTGGDDVFVYFRKSFYLTTNPNSALLRVTADDDYWVYVNGIFVGSDSHYFGDAPEFHWQTAEIYDVTTLLNEDKNVIAVMVYDWGLYEGLLLDCIMEGTELSPINFWTSFPRWVGFIIFGVVIFSVAVAIMYVPRRISKKVLVAIINSRGQVSFKTLANEFGTNERKIRKKVNELITKQELKAHISEDGKRVELN